ncbi:MAG: hypothetical protein ACK4S2_12015 [Gemmobacter sp.]|uniref:hypothetical protein n=1 Tax=Gemmobacter sp. TaxID=1898957 RepID=UPI00391D9C72
MNFDQIVNTISRIFLRRAVNWGLNKGIDTVAGKGKPKGQMTEAERHLANKGRETAKMARKAARITRRLGR